MIREPSGLVDRALKGKTVIEVKDMKDRIELKLDNGSIISLFSDMRMGADGGYYHEMIIAENGREIAYR